MSLFYLHGTIALIALLFKIGYLFQIKIYSQLSAATVVLSLLLVAQNSTEFLGYLLWYNNPGTASYLIHLYIASLYLICCALVYLAVVTVKITGKTLVGLVFFSLALYLAILQTSGYLILGFSQNDYTITSEPGALYSHFLIYVAGSIISAVLVLIYGIITKPYKIKNQCKVILLALSPMFAIGLGVVVLRSIGIDASSAMFLPIATTFFLVSLIYMDKDGSFIALSIKWRVIWQLAKLSTLSVGVWKETVEKELILGAIKFEPDSQRKAADIIEMSQPTMSRRLEKMHSAEGSVESIAHEPGQGQV